MDKGDWICVGAGSLVIFGVLSFSCWLDKKDNDDYQHYHAPCMGCEIEHMRSLVRQLKPFPENLMITYELQHCLDMMELHNDE